MTTRSILIALHWALFLILLAILKGGTVALPWRWAFVLTGGAWLALMLWHGIQARPGPKLTGPLRQSFRAFHATLYALIAVSVVLNLLSLMGQVPLIWAWNSLLVLLVAAIFHAILHLWRHTALNDGALRMIVPRVWHKFL